MICILTMASAEIRGWIIAVDLPEARRQADGAMERDLATELYRMEFDPAPGKYTLRTGHILLVS